MPTVEQVAFAGPLPLAMVLEKIDLGIVGVSPSAELVVYSNPKARELLGGELLAQKLGEVAVDLDGGFVACAGDDFARERGLARADFNESVARLRVDAAHDALDPVAVMKEVLTEAFAGLVPFKPFLFHGSSIKSVLIGGRRSCSCRPPCPVLRCRAQCRGRPRS